MKRERHWLLSLGNDGRVLLWELSKKGVGRHQEHLQLLRRMQLRANNIPRSLQVSKVHTDAEMGGECDTLKCSWCAVNASLFLNACLFPGTSLSFTAEDKSVFVAGCENGALVKCSLDTAAVAVGVPPPLLTSELGGEGTPCNQGYSPTHDHYMDDSLTYCNLMVMSMT